MRYRLSLGCVYLFSLIAFGCSFELPTDYEKRGLTLEEYRQIILSDDPCALIMPTEASSIDIYSRQGRDSNEDWWKISGIHHSGILDLITALDADLQDTGYIKNRVVLGLPKVDTIIPSHWPEKQTDWPTWWVPDVETDVFTWEREEENTSVRSKGWLVAYEHNSATAYIWRWDYQHSWLGWSQKERCKSKGTGVDSIQ